MKHWLILVVVLISNSVVWACEEVYVLSTKKAQRLLEQANRALVSGDPQVAYHLINDAFKNANPDLFDVPGDAPLLRRIRTAHAVAMLRSYPPDAPRILTKLKTLQLYPDDLYVKTRIAEALYLGNQIAAGRQILEQLADSNLVSDAEGYAVLSLLRKSTGDAEGAARALARCQQIAKNPGTQCSNTPGRKKANSDKLQPHQYSTRLCCDCKPLQRDGIL